VPDCRYVIACDIHRLLTGLGGKDAAREICLTHLALRTVTLFRLGNRVLVPKEALAAALGATGFVTSPPSPRGGS